MITIASSGTFRLPLAVDLPRLHADIQLALLIDQKCILLLLFWFRNLSGVVQRRLVGLDGQQLLVLVHLLSLGRLAALFLFIRLLQFYGLLLFSLIPECLQI